MRCMGLKSTPAAYASDSLWCGFVLSFDTLSVRERSRHDPH